MFAGEGYEKLMATITVELRRSLGHCTYCDRGNCRCLGFRPRADEISI